MVFKDGYHCKECGKKYPNAEYEWCRLCQTSGNKHIDDFIQEKQLKSNQNNDVVKWIPYNQFADIKEVDKGGFSTVYSAIWKSDEKVALKYLHNSRKVANEFINEV